MLSKECVSAEAVTCRRGMALLAECATGQKEDGPVDQFAGLIGAKRFSKKNRPG